jgi:hypothetical protein
MTSNYVPLASRKLSSGLAERTLKNLDFIKKVSDTEDVHPVTQVVNSLLALLVFPVEKEKTFFNSFASVKFKAPTDLSAVTATLNQELSLPSLHVVMFQRCPHLSKFFEKVRNAVSHKLLEFSGNPDSRILAEVTVTLKDRLDKDSPFDWQISMTAEDLERLSRFVAEKIIKLGL